MKIKSENIESPSLTCAMCLAKRQSPVVAVCRAIVMSHLGEMVEIPQELMDHPA